MICECHVSALTAVVVLDTVDPSYTTTLRITLVWSYKRDGRSRGIHITLFCVVRQAKYGRIRGMVVGEGGRSTGVLLYNLRIS